ncbi:MAG: hypothetical protein QNK37_06455 [Acidobacteriota bacterium]|nr:hypothetical protein [Acidobacteriota bacterium]
MSNSDSKSGCLKFGLGCLAVVVLVLVAAGVFVGLNWGDFSKGIQAAGEVLETKREVREKFQAERVEMAYNDENERESIHLTLINPPFADRDDETLERKAREIASFAKTKLTVLAEIHGFQIAVGISRGEGNDIVEGKEFYFPVDEL